MASIQFEEIYAVFLGSVTDYTFVKLDTDKTKTLLQEYLHKALAGSYVRQQFENISINDDSQEIVYELKNSVDADSDKDFVINMTSKFMIHSWLDKQVHNTTLTQQALVGAEQKMYSQALHLSEVRALRDEALKEARDYIADHGLFNNSYLSKGRKS